jgi:hypothetical protein
MHLHSESAKNEAAKVLRRVELLALPSLKEFSATKIVLQLQFTRK